MAESQNTVQNMKNSIVTYFKGVRAEWGKITWPAKMQVLSETIWVVLIVTGFTVFIYVLDMVFKLFFNLIKLG